MKQLILPHDINEVTMQTEILTHPKVTPSTLDQGCAWLERDAASIESMHENGPAGPSEDDYNICPGSPERHHPVLSYSGQYLGQSLSQASVARV